MKAIVLTYDKYRAMTEHMIFQYNKLWPDHPFIFRIPFQSFQSTDIPNCEFIQTSTRIKATILKLLEDLDDEEWIYWCIDDKYPIELKIPEISRLTNNISSKNIPTEISGISFCRCRNLRKRKFLTGDKFTDKDGNIYLERRDYNQIWLHQFLKVKVLRHLFNHFPDEISSAKQMDELKSLIALPGSHRLYVTKKNLAVFGESTSRGLLTQNCYESITKNNLHLPQWFSSTTGEKITIGNQNSYIKRIGRFLKNSKHVLNR